MASGIKILHVRVLEAAGLLRADMVGSSDPYAVVKLTGVSKHSTTKPHKTKYKKHTVFPLWDEVFSYHVHSDDVEKGVLNVAVWDYDTLGKGDEIGECSLPLAEIAKKCADDSQNIWKGWFCLDDPGKKSPVAGQIYICVNFNDDLRTSKTWRGNKKLDYVPIVSMPSLDEKNEKDTTIACCTMNSGNAAPPDNMGIWVPSNTDIVAIGLQECTWKTDDDCQEFFLDCAMKCLNAEQEDKYRCLSHHSLGEMRLYLFVLADKLKKVSNIRTGQEATGLAGVVANKGGVTISFDFGGTSLCFVNSHLAAHQNMKERRDFDYAEICRGTQVGNPKQQMVNQFHHMFWMGDLNYRVDFGVQEENSPSEDVWNQMVKLVNEKNYDRLWKYDQLTDSRKKKRAFVGFQEGKPSFDPTFKVFPDKPFEYQKKRSPAWCDRVLWRSAQGFENEIKCSSYDCVPAITTSDHKPVRAVFNVNTWERSPGVCDKTAPMYILFEHIKGNNLVVSDLMSEESDPYLHFPRQPCLAKHQQSKHVTKNINPKWEPKKLPNLRLIRNNKEFLDKALFFLQVRDYDRFSTDDKIGFGALSFREALKNPNKSTKFEQELMLNGKSAGTLTGQFILKEVN